MSIEEHNAIRICGVDLCGFSLELPQRHAQRKIKVRCYHPTHENPNNPPTLEIIRNPCRYCLRKYSSP